MSKVVWLITGLAALAALPAARGSGWSAPRSLAACGVSAAPPIAFPSASPTEATGSGAIVWLASSGCARARGGRAVESLSIAWHAAGERPSRTTSQALAAGWTTRWGPAAELWFLRRLFIRASLEAGWC